MVGHLKVNGVKVSNEFLEPFSGELINNGHVLQWNIDASDRGKWTISHPQLPNLYILEQFHFHWGSTNAQGSEHTINGVAYPMEMHLVHYNSKYTSLTNALNSGDDDALAVMAIMFHVGKNSFTGLDPIIDALQGDNLDTFEDTEPATVKLGLFIREVGFGHYYYKGSLTTPTCNEQVFWIVMERSISISQLQVCLLRG